MENISNSDDLREILKEIMQNRQLTINSWSQLAGTSEGTMRFFLNGTNNSLKVSTLNRYLKAVGLDIKDLGSKDGHKIIIKGYLHDGAEVRFFDDMNGEVELPVNMRNNISLKEIHALRVMNNYLLPLVQKDWIIYYHAKNNIKSCIKKLALVTTSDNRMYIKELDNGSKPKHYTLRGFNHATIENVKIISAFPILSFEPN